MADSFSFTQIAKEYGGDNISHRLILITASAQYFDF